MRGAVPKAWFHTAPAACAGDAPCPSRARAFLVAHDAVELSSNVAEVGGFVCARFRPARGRATVGWLSADALERRWPVRAPAPRVAATAWLGTWEAESAELRIAAGGGGGGARLRVVGRASAGANTGEVDAPMRADGDLMVAGDVEGGCSVTLQLANNALLAWEHGTCGGAGVSFTGVYRRR